MRLILVRHPKYVEDMTDRCIGQTNALAIPVSTHLVTTLFRQIGWIVTAVVTSDLLRAAQFAKQIASVFERPLYEDHRLREISMGRWENRTWGEIEAEYPTQLEAWFSDFVNVRPPEGESFVELRTRVRSWLQDLDRTGVYVVVTHAGVIRTIACEALNIPLENAFRIAPQHLSLTVLEQTSEGTLRLACISPGSATS